MMEMKKSNLTKFIKTSAMLCCALILSFVSLIFTGCADNNKLNMNYYTLANSTYTTITNTAETTTPSTDFISSNKIKRQYLKATVKLSSEWLYLLKLEKFAFTIETNANVNLEFNIIITNLKDGKLDGAMGVKTKTFKVVCEQKAHKAHQYIIEINDIFELSAANTYIIFELTNYEIYITNGYNNNTTFSISDLSLYGKHQLN